MEFSFDGVHQYVLTEIEDFTEMAFPLGTKCDKCTSRRLSAGFFGTCRLTNRPHKAFVTTARRQGVKLDNPGDTSEPVTIK